jgi:hypothetical protein
MVEAEDSNPKDFDSYIQRLDEEILIHEQTQ